MKFQIITRKKIILGNNNHNDITYKVNEMKFLSLTWPNYTKETLLKFSNFVRHIVSNTINCAAYTIKCTLKSNRKNNKFVLNLMKALEMCHITICQ